MSAAVRIAELTAEDAGRWDRFVASQPQATLYHSSRWRTLLSEAHGHVPCYLLAEEAGSVRGVLPLVHVRSLLFGNFAISLPHFNYGGPLADSPAVAGALMRAAQERAQDWGCRHLELRCAQTFDVDYPMKTGKVCMVLELPASVEGLSQRIGSKLRAQIRRPEREGASVQRGGEDLLPEFYAVFARNMRDLGTPVYGREFFRRIVRGFPGEATVLVVRIGSQPVAAALLLRHGDTLEIPWASSLREHNRSGANMLLYWEALKHAVALGCRRFDFGRSTPDSGTFKFKRQWGAEPRQLYWYFWVRGAGALPDLSPASPRYQLAVKVWQRLPLPIANSLGPTLARYLG